MQQSAASYRARRVAVEHRLARLVQLGIRQSRYFGRVKTRFQLYLAATVANLTLVAGKIELSDSVPTARSVPSSVPLSAVLSAVRSDLQAVSHGGRDLFRGSLGLLHLGIMVVPVRRAQGNNRLPSHFMEAGELKPHLED